MALALDVHQHLWPVELVDRLRARTRAPFLRGWTLHTDHEAPYVVEPGDHDPELRVALDRAAGVGTACLSLSAPLGLESLPGADADALLDAWHHGVTGLPEHFRAWASVTAAEPDVVALAALLADERWVGLQLPATSLLSPAAWEQAGPVLREAELAGKPLLVHPGPATGAADGGRPGWWAPVVDYVAQQQAAWWAWQAVGGRAAHPTLRVVFAAAAGLAPVHHERHVMRGGVPAPVDPQVYVDSSGYGPRALDAVVRVLGIDALVLGSDRPYATGVTELFGDAATHAVRVSNPRRLLGAPPDTPPRAPRDPSTSTSTTSTDHEKENPSWAVAN